jgi:hypothetical protein
VGQRVAVFRWRSEALSPVYRHAPDAAHIEAERYRAFSDNGTTAGHFDVIAGHADFDSTRPAHLIALLDDHPLPGWRQLSCDEIRRERTRRAAGRRIFGDPNPREEGTGVRGRPMLSWFQTKEVAALTPKRLRHCRQSLGIDSDAGKIVDTAGWHEQVRRPGRDDLRIETESV